MLFELLTINSFVLYTTTSGWKKKSTKLDHPLGTQFDLVPSMYFSRPGVSFPYYEIGGNLVITENAVFFTNGNKRQNSFGFFISEDKVASRNDLVFAIDFQPPYFANSKKLLENAFGVALTSKTDYNSLFGDLIKYKSQFEKDRNFRLLLKAEESATLLFRTEDDGVVVDFTTRRSKVVHPTDDDKKSITVYLEKRRKAVCKLKNSELRTVEVWIVDDASELGVAEGGRRLVLVANKRVCFSEALSVRSEPEISPTNENLSKEQLKKDKTVFVQQDDSLTVFSKHSLKSAGLRITLFGLKNDQPMVRKNPTTFCSETGANTSDGAKYFDPRLALEGVRVYERNNKRHSIDLFSHNASDAELVPLIDRIGDEHHWVFYTAKVIGVVVFQMVVVLLQLGLLMHFVDSQKLKHKKSIESVHKDILATKLRTLYSKNVAVLFLFALVYFLVHGVDAGLAVLCVIVALVLVLRNRVDQEVVEKNNALYFLNLYGDKMVVVGYIFGMVYGFVKMILMLAKQK